MKRIMKKATCILLAFALAFSAAAFLPQTTEEAQASSSVYINPYSDKIVSYKPADSSYSNSAVISIVGCSKASQIKKLKSSNSAISVSAQDGYIRAEYGKKACKATITCTVKGVSLKTTLQVVKYTNPLKTFKIGSTSYKSGFAKTDSQYTTKKIKSKKLTLAAKSGWRIAGVYVYNGSSTKNYTVDKKKFSKNISLTADYSYVSVTLENTKTGLVEYLYLTKRS